MNINGTEIGPDRPPYIICELSANHNGVLESARRLVRAGVAAGANAIKIQSYTPDSMTLDAHSDEFIIKGGLWDGRRLYDLYSEAATPYRWHAEIFELARDLGVTAFSTPFDTSAVDMLEGLGAPAYKIASFEAVDLPLIRYVASTGKPMIISTGMADLAEIGEAVDAARQAGCEDLALLHCVSGYPAPASDYNLRTMVDMRETFQCPVGLSDHTLDNTTAIAAVALGASLIEKHFTLSRAGGGPDDSFSLEPADFSQLCATARLAWEALGKVDYGLKSSELGNVQFRRSLYWVKDLDAGAVVTPDAIRSVRPGYGLPPKRFDELIGQRVVRAVRATTATREEDFGL